MRLFTLPHVSSQASEVPEDRRCARVQAADWESSQTYSNLGTRSPKQSRLLSLISLFSPLGSDKGTLASFMAIDKHSMQESFLGLNAQMISKDLVKTLEEHPKLQGN